MTHIFRFRKCFASGCGYLIYYLGLNMKELFYNNLKDREKAYVHTVKFLESMIESVPQIGLAFYIIHRHGFDEPVFPEGYNFEGDLQMLSLFGSVLSITISMATRRAYHKSIFGPEKKDIFIAALWNFIPLGCFLTTYYIFMSDSWIILIIYFCTCPLFFIFSLVSAMSGSKKIVTSKFFTMTIFLLLNTFVMSALHTIGYLLIQSGIGNKIIHFITEDLETQRSMPFNICYNNETIFNSTSSEVPSVFNSTAAELLTIFNSTANKDPAVEVSFYFAPDQNPELCIYILWGAVVAGLIHSIAEFIFVSDDEKVSFLWFIMTTKEAEEAEDGFESILY